MENHSEGEKQVVLKEFDSICQDGSEVLALIHICEH